MTRYRVWLAAGLLVMAGPPGWAASTGPAASAASPAQVDRLETLLDEVEQLDGEIDALTQQAASARQPEQLRRLHSQLDALTARRTALAAQLEPLLPAFPALQQRWNGRRTAERSDAIEHQVDQQLKRQEILLESTANERARR